MICFAGHHNDYLLYLFSNLIDQRLNKSRA